MAKCRCLAERRTATQTITIEVAEMVDEFVGMLEDTPDFLAGRILAAIGGIAPPCFHPTPKR